MPLLLGAAAVAAAPPPDAAAPPCVPLPRFARREPTAAAPAQLAEGMPECSAATMSELEAQLVDACTEAAGKEFKGFNYQCDMVTKTVALFTASPNPKPAGA